jgi:acyl-CoA reductase-like NAD-dependent aldehyde dehydrogenase
MKDHLAIALEAAARPFPLSARKRLLLDWAAAIEAATSELAALITQSTRKPIALARQEVGRALVTIRSTAEATARLEPATQSLDGSGSVVVHHAPLGPVLAVTPFNFPVNLVAHKLAPAIAAGCPIIYKPSPNAPGVGEKLVALLAQAGMPADFVQLTHLSNEAVAEMVRDPRLGVFSFTGSAAVGHQLQSQTARARVMLELGGNAAVIVHEVDDVANVARRIANAACGNAGQACISVQRIFMRRDDNALREALTAAFRSVPVGDPNNEQTICGPVINQAAKQRIDGLIDQYRKAGGQLLTGGEWNGLTLQPTLIENVPAQAPCVRDTEAFAPLATLHAYDRIDDAISAADDTPFGLQAGLFARDEQLIQRAFERMSVGALVINEVPTRRDDRLPYGGMKGSGVGREGAMETLLEYSQPKLLWRPLGK